VTAQGINGLAPPLCHPNAVTAIGCLENIHMESDMPQHATTFVFTAERIKALKPDTKRVDYWDATLGGFGLRVTPKNVKTWFYWYRTGAVKRRWTIGRSPQISLADARELARAAYGKDPAREKVEGRHAQTFGELCEALVRLHAKPNTDGQLVDIAVGGRDERLHVWLLLGHPDEVGQRLGVHLFA
jgi:hypothetical protein